MLTINEPGAKVTDSAAMLGPDNAIRRRSNEFLRSIGTPWKNMLFASVFVITAFTLSGCASRMAFQRDTDTVAATTGTVFLMTATLRNDYRPFFQPWARSVIIERTVQNDDTLHFLVDAKARNNESYSSELGNSYYFRMELEKGIYVIRGVRGIGGGAIFPRNTFFVPLHAQISSPGTGIIYLGHVSAVVRERVGDEFRAGGLYRFIDQAITGYFWGTFDVEITDQFERDEPEFRSRFPALKDANIQKAILPPFDRAKAQQRWEERWNTY